MADQVSGHFALSGKNRINIFPNEAGLGKTTTMIKSLMALYKKDSTVKSLIVTKRKDEARWLKKVEVGDVSTDKLTKKVCWVVVKDKISEYMAKAIACDILSNGIIDEVSVYIYDNRNGALNGIIQYKLFDIVLSKGKVVQVIKNLFYK